MPITTPPDNSIQGLKSPPPQVHKEPSEKAATQVLTIHELTNRIADFQHQGLCVGLCHGCFDLLHTGHLRHFEAARENCDVLVVSVTPDRFIGKGPGRPIFPEHRRAELIAGLAVVQHTCINQWETAIELLAALSPHVYFKGQEYEHNAQQVNANFLKEQDAAEKAGINVVFTHEDVLSSSDALKLFQKINPKNNPSDINP